MNTSLEQQNFPDPSSVPSVFSSDPLGVKEKPEGTHYANGVAVGYTAPAKWWNWLWNHITAWLRDSKIDKTNIRTEMLNTLTAGELSPENEEMHQFSGAIDNISYDTADDYDNEEITEEIDGVMVTHKVNQPYVVGHTLHIPNTELL